MSSKAKPTPKRTPRCGWCGWQGDSWPAVADHVALECSKTKEVNAPLKKHAELLKHTADILEHKTCPYEQEPLTAALENITKARDELKAIIEARDKNLRGDTP